MKTIKIGNFEGSNDKPFFLIAGPCQLESKDHAFMICETLLTATQKLGTGYVFKASYDKANRTSLHNIRGVGIDKGLEILSAVREKFGVPVLTDVHDIPQTERAGKVVDIVQIPAFLSRQTDLLIAAGKTGKVVNIKKAQFMAPWDVKTAAAKISEGAGNDHILLTERGVSFGYNTLVVDMTAFPIMAETGYPVIIDATHAIQKPSAQGGKSGGNREHAKVIARAAVASGVAGVFIETHQDPDNAPSDGPNSIKLDDMPALLKQLQEIDRVVKKI